MDELNTDCVFQSRDPSNGVLFATRETWQSEELACTLAHAAQAASRWAQTSQQQRSSHLLAVSQALRRASAALADSLCREMGKLRSEAEDEILRAGKWCEFMAAQAGPWLADEQNATGIIKRQPLGVVLAVTPWNYPIWQIIRPLAAALMAGNALVVKPAPNVAQTSTLFEHLCRDILPAGLVQCLWLDDAGTAQTLAHPLVSMLVCTGGENTGRRLGALAGQHLKPAVLELGGNNAFIVLDDADPVAAAEAAAQSRCLNAGQACTAAKRFIVHADIARPFTQALQEALRHYQCRRNLAPLARQGIRDRLASQVRSSLDMGANCLLGGAADGGDGYYYPATLLSAVQPGMPAFDEEMFGPVAAISIARNDAEALRLANGVRQHLAASIWSRDRRRAEQLAKQLRVGMVCFNSRTSSRFELPFAGSGASGYGSTLGRDGLLTFTRPVGWLE